MSPLAKVEFKNGGSGIQVVPEDVWLIIKQEAESIRYILQSPVPQVILDLIGDRKDSVRLITLFPNHGGILYAGKREMVSPVVGVELPE